MKHAVIIGGAQCWREDLAALVDLYGRPWDGLWLAVNDAGVIVPKLDHWCTVHAEKAPRWKAQRRALGNPPAPLWSFTKMIRPEQDRVHLGWIHGSSGLYAVSVALQALGCTRVVLCGIPMDEQPNAHHPAPLWSPDKFRHTWGKHMHELGGVRSMSGWTRERLGMPDLTWLEAA